jgi:hypothetical protein
MSRADTDLGDVMYRQEHSSWRELWLKEDWWAIWLGVGDRSDRLSLVH